MRISRDLKYVYLHDYEQIADVDHLKSLGGKKIDTNTWKFPLDKDDEISAQYGDLVLIDSDDEPMSDSEARELKDTRHSRGLHRAGSGDEWSSSSGDDTDEDCLKPSFLRKRYTSEEIRAKQAALREMAEKL